MKKGECGLNPKFNDFPEPFIIAEIGGNHEGDFGRAKELLKLAAASGAHAIKFQTYTGDKLFSPIEAPERNRHCKKFELTLDNFLELARMTRAAGREFMTTINDEDALEVLDPHLNIHKIASGDVNNYPLIEKIALTGKPVVVSTAMCEMDDVRGLVEFVRRCNPELFAKRRFALLHCVAMYGDPKDEHANLLSIRKLQDEFPDLAIGYSDHTKGAYACEIALGMGASVIEVHFTDDKTRAFRDHEFSIDVDEMRELVAKSKRITTLLGAYRKAPMPAVESPQRIREFRRAVYLKRDAEAGTVLTRENLITLRPNHGIDARRFYDVLGKKLKRGVKAYAALSWDDLEG